MGMSDYAIEQIEKEYQGYDEEEAIECYQEKEKNYYHRKREDDLIDNLVDEWLEYKTDERAFWEGI